MSKEVINQFLVQIAPFAAGLALVLVIARLVYLWRSYADTDSRNLAIVIAFLGVVVLAALWYIGLPDRIPR